MSTSPAVTFYPVDRKVNEDKVDETLALPDKDESPLVRVMATIKNLASVSELIRLGGASAIVGSMFMFLVDSASIVNDQQRFYSMLPFTGLLSTAGLAMSWILKEQRGARAFSVLRSYRFRSILPFWGRFFTPDLFPMLH